MKTAVFAGTFDPFTIGHASIVRRGLQIFDAIHICIGVNLQKPGAAQTAQQRAEHLRSLYAAEPRVQVAVYDGLTAEYAQKVGAKFLLRGVRSIKDFEYEQSMADANQAVMGLETVLLLTEPQLAFVSSSLLRELAAFGHDITPYLPTPETI